MAKATEAGSNRLRVDSEAHRELTMSVLEAAGVPRELAREQAELLLEGDLRGHASHGIRRLEVIVGRIRSGLTVPDAEGRREWRSDAALAVDGENGLGPPVANRAVDAIVERARTTGVAVAAVRRANHLGMLAPYVERIADAGLIGLATTTSEALVHPWGGRPAMVGTNPLAMAIPVGDGKVVLDMATGQISMGKVLDHAARGEPLPPDSAVDADGLPTTDASAATDGAISPFGGPKGYALAVSLELLVAALSGTALGTEVTGTLDTDRPCTKGDVLIALSPPVFGGAAGSALSGYVEALRGCEPAPGHDHVAVPGDGARARREASLRDGVLVATASWHRAAELADELGVAPATGGPRS